MRRFRFRHHGLVLLDELEAETAATQRKLFQAGVVWVCAALSWQHSIQCHRPTHHHYWARVDGAMNVTTAMRRHLGDGYGHYAMEE